MPRMQLLKAPNVTAEEGFRRADKGQTDYCGGEFGLCRRIGVEVGKYGFDLGLAGFAGLHEFFR